MKAFRWLFICAVLALAFVACAYSYGPAKGWFYRTFRTPTILHSTFIVDYDKQQATSQRQKLFEIYQAKSGSFGLHRVGGSIEGTPVGAYLIVESGHITLIHDFTRDAYGCRTFTTRYPTNIVLAPVSPSEASPPITPPEGMVVLKCYLDGGVINF